jgi:murein DD-endopeptidase MepM/ murein hydrolase activator NlpD
VPEIVEGQRIIIPGGIIEAPRPVATPRPVSRPPSAPVFTQPVQTPGATFAWPVAGGRGVISQRYHGGHRALDIADSARPPVVAMSNGTVIFAGRNDNTCGDQVNIAYDNGFTSIYCHLGSIDPSILSSYRSGARPRVVTGQVVGNMGATGYVTGIHLHMAILYQSVLVNPCAYDSIRARC